MAPIEQRLWQFFQQNRAVYGGKYADLATVKTIGNDIEFELADCVSGGDV